MKRAVGRVVAMLAMSFTASCVDSIFGCKTYLAASIRVEILDATTGAPAADSSTVVIRGSGFVDSVTVAAGSSLMPMWSEDRIDPGRYTVTVRKPGYREWTQSVKVDRDGCHTSSEHVTARLERLP